MKKFTSFLSTLPKRYLALFGILAASVIIPVSVLASHGPGSVPYLGDNTVGADHAAFNIFSGDVPGNPSDIGEQDFLTVSPAGERAWVNAVEACEGSVDLHVYIHNGAETHTNGDNLDGEGVATGTTLKVDLPSAAGNLEAIIDSDQTSPISDGATISCGDHEIEIEYVPGSAQIYRSYTGNLDSLSDDVVGPNGTSIGSIAGDGVVPGCWEYRQYVVMTVNIKKVEKPEPVYQCDALNAIFVDRNTRQLNAAASVANGAEVVSYEFDFGDGASETVTTDQLSATTGDHTYAPGSYSSAVTVNFDVDGDGQADVSDDCVEQIEIDEEPVYQCIAVTPSVDDENPFHWTFTTQTSMSDDVSINKYIYDFGVEGEDAVHSDQNPISKIYEDYGTYDVDVRVVFNVGETQEEDDCGTTVTITPPKTPPELPKTGAASVLAGLFGTGALSYTARGWFNSRAGLRKKLLDRA